MPENIIITGIPRCGTTLLTAMIDGAPDSVALNEPKWQYDWAERHASAGAEYFVRWLAEDFAATRTKLVQGTPIPERRGEANVAVTNYYRDGGQHTYQVVPFTRESLTAGMTLAMKHNGLYLGVLRSIVASGAFKVIAILRNPLHAIASWSRAPIPPSEGRLPGAALYWEEVRRLGDSDMEILEKQVRLYDLLCRRLHRLRDRIDIVLYEDLLRDPACLPAYAKVDAAQAASLITPKEPRADTEEQALIRECIKRCASYIGHFYPDL